MNKPMDIIDLIKQHHKPIKDLVKVLRDQDRRIGERQRAFDKFVPLLLAHARSEEKVLYSFLKKNKLLREDGFEGDIEHNLADDMAQQAKISRDEDLWSARAKVLADLVDTHLKEEENRILPRFKKYSTIRQRENLGHDYSQDYFEERSGVQPQNLHRPGESYAHMW